MRSVTNPAQTAQELDPVGRVTSRAVSTAVSAVNVLIACGLTLNPHGRSEISSAPLAIAAIIVLLVANWMMFRFSDPYGPVFSRRRFQLVYAGVLIAAILCGLSQLGQNTLSRDDWGPIAVGLVLLCAGPNRPPREIAWWTVQGVLVTGALAVLQVTTSATEVGLPLVIIVAITPPLAIGLGAIAYSRNLIAGLRAERTAEIALRREHDDAVRQLVRDEKSLEDLGSLTTAIVPFLTRLSIEGRLSDSDRTRAAELSAVLRADIVEHLAFDPWHEIVAVIDDPDRWSREITERQRVALRAILVALEDRASVDPGSVRLRFVRMGSEIVGTIAVSDSEVQGAKSTLAPFVKTLRFVFQSAELQIHNEIVTIRFSFDVADLTASRRI